MAHKFFVTLNSLFLVLLLSIVTLVTGQENNRSCPHYGLNFGKRCFWFVDVRTTWYEAGHLCHRLYGDHVTLVTIKDGETNDFIRSQWQRGFWIGLHEAHGEGNWRWVDNTEPSNGNYQNWEGGATPLARPGNRNCGLMKYDNDMWIDYDCGARAFFVCAELPSPPMCPHGGIFFRDRCYWRGTRQLSWTAANQACQDDFGPDARLVVARDAETNLFLSRLAGRHIWLGLSDRRVEGVWEWIDGAPFEYSNWAYNEPNDHGGNEDCSQLIYPSAKWNDYPCGDPVPGSGRVRFTLSYICAIPPCYETTENEELGTVRNQEVQIIDHSICAQTECTQQCVNGGACNSRGQCICVKQFDGMTCNLDEWEVEMENEVVNTTTGSTLTLKCNVNLPPDHISSLSWSKCEPGFLPQYRKTITNYFSRGFSILQVFDVSLVDAGEYHCKVVLDFGDHIELNVARKAFVNITEGPTPEPTTKPTTERMTTEEKWTTSPISSTNSATTTNEASTPLATTIPTTVRAITKETSTQMRTTKPTTERTSTIETQTSATALKRVSTKTTTVRAVDEQPVSSPEPTADKPTNEEQRTKKGIKNFSESQDASKYSAKQPAGGTTALIVILLITTILLLGTVAVLMMKLKKRERDTSENGGLIELEENNS